jgi:hypothetical protein
MLPTGSTTDAAATNYSHSSTRVPANWDGSYLHWMSGNQPVPVTAVQLRMPATKHWINGMLSTGSTAKAATTDNAGAGLYVQQRCSTAGQLCAKPVPEAQLLMPEVAVLPSANVAMPSIVHCWQLLRQRVVV